MPVAAIIAGTGAITGAGLQAYAANESGKFNADMYNYQAKLNKQRAALATQNGEMRVKEAAERRRQLVSTGKVDFAANGLLLDTSPDSAPNLWEQGQAAELAYETASIRNAAEAEAWGFRAQASIDRSNASMAEFTGRMGVYSALLGGFSGTAGAVSGGMSSSSAASSSASSAPAK